MSGGFFRGTSADQDTRFSNKQAKLLKSQKFAPELDHLVDIAKVKMDVVKPWIATRVTELLGFEDEVLINFIYGLLDGKEINGKQVQIQLTGFMEKNTGKFMKELWLLLLSAQKNSSGVPQQFLDAKEEELRKKKEAEDEKNRKKKEEADRITHEIQKKKEAEQERTRKTDDEVDTTRSLKDASDPFSKHLHPRDTAARKEEEKESEERSGSRGMDRRSRSPLPADRAPSSERGSPRSISKSFSRSRSYSDDRNRSRSMSRSPPRRRSISPDRRYRSPRRRSISPRRRHSPRRPRSPIRRRSPYSRHRSVSRSLRRSPSPARRRSPSPARRRSPIRRRSPSPKWRKSRSPLRRRSPSPKRRRSPSPSRRRSPPPMRRRSPSPKRRRSPSPFERRLRRGSPIPRHRSPSPFRRRSPSPRRRSPSPLKRRSPPLRSPKQRRRSPMRSPRQGNRTRSPYRSRSPAYRSHRSLSRDHQTQTNGVGPRRNHDDYASERVRGKRSPVHHTPEREEVDHRPPITLRSPQREPRKQTDAHKRMPVLSRSPEKSISQSDSSPRTRKMVPMEDRRRTSSPSVSPVRKTRERVVRTDSGSPVRQREDPSSYASPGISREEEIRRARGDGGQRTVSPENRVKLSPEVDDKKISKAGEARARTDNAELRRKDRDRKSEKASVRVEHPGSSTEHTTVLLEGSGPGRMERETLTLDSVGEQSYSKKRSRSNNFDGTVQSDEEGPSKSVKGADHNKRPATSDSDNEEKEKYRSEGLEKRKHKRSARHHMSSDDDASYDSQVDTRKEAKRKRKEEKRLRKEEKRRRREERHRKKEERRAGKLKAKLMDTVEPPSDIEKNRSDADYVDGNVASRRESHPSDIEEAETEQKKLEIELRKKALESLRAKKAINP